MLLVVILHVPLGNYMARVYTDSEHWRVERVIYRLIGAQPDNRQRWSNYGFSLLAFSAVSVLFLYARLLAQTRLPEPWGHKGMMTGTRLVVQSLCDLGLVGRGPL